MLKRDRAYIAQQLSLKDEKYVTSKRTIIEFPSWYKEKGLYDISDTTFIYGVFAIIIDDRYSVSVIPTIMSTTPVMVTEVDKDGVSYTQFHYAPGDVLLNTSKVIMQPFLVYNIFDMFFMQAKIPWFIEYLDLCKIMDNTVTYGGTNFGKSYIGNEVLTSFITRSGKDKFTFYRQDKTKGIEYVDLMDVRYSTLSTVNKIAGNYFEESLVSALVQKEKKPTTLENHVRS